MFAKAMYELQNIRTASVWGAVVEAITIILSAEACPRIFPVNSDVIRDPYDHMVSVYQYFVVHILSQLFVHSQPTSFQRRYLTTCCPIERRQYCNTTRHRQKHLCSRKTLEEGSKIHHLATIKLHRKLRRKPPLSLQNATRLWRREKV